MWGPAADDLIAIRDGSGNQFYVVQDKLRSVRGLVRRDGTWLMSQRFGPYGAVAAQDIDTTGIGFVLRYAWTGREFDVETGFYYFRARYFDPTVRRFVQEDPIGFAGGGNLYAYAGGNPVERRDPSGLMWNAELLYYGRCACSSGDDGWDGGWTFVPDGSGGGEWMPPGMNGAAQEAFVDLIFGMATIVAAQDAAYNQYLAAAQTQATNHGGDPMTRAQYDAAIRALRRRQTNPAYALLVLDIISQGGILVDTHGQLTACCGGSRFRPGFTLLFLSDMSSLSWVHPGVFRQPGGFIANVLIHETLHWINNLLPANQRSGECEIYRDAFRTSGYRINPDPGMGCPAF